VAGHYAKVFCGTPDDVCGSTAGILMAEAVKTESSHAESHSPILGNGIGGCLIWHVGVEGCVETGHGRGGSEHVSDKVDAGQGLGLVKWRE